MKEVAKIYMQFTGANDGKHFAPIHPSMASEKQPYALIAWPPPKGQYVIPGVQFTFPNGGQCADFVILDFGDDTVHFEISPSATLERTMIQQAALFYGPLTKKPYCRKLVPAVMSLDRRERQDFMISIGQTPKRARHATALLFCCVRIHYWGLKEFTYKQAAEDAERHNIKLTAEAIRAYAKRGDIPKLKSDPLGKPDKLK